MRISTAACLLVALLLGGCGGASESKPAAVDETAADQDVVIDETDDLAASIRERPPLELRPVLEVVGSATCDPPGVPAADGSNCYTLGSASLRLERYGAIASTPLFEGDRQAQVMFDGGDDLASFNSLAAMCFDKTADCPTGMIAIVFDGVVQSAPTVQEPRFAQGIVSITGFTEDGLRRFVDAAGS